jgi:hypothetical protein
MLLLPRFPGKPGLQLTFQLLAAVASCGLQYVWLFNDSPLMFRIWGFSLLPAFSVSLLFVFMLFQFGGLDKFSLLSFLGKFSHWMQALLYPLLVFALTYALFILSGNDANPDWKWTTLAMSSGADLLMIFIWTLPMTLGIIFVWLTPQSSFASRINLAGRLLISALLFMLANGTILFYLFSKANSTVGAGVLAFSFALGSFVYRIQEHGSVLPAAFSLVLLALLFSLAFGSQLKEVNHILFGYSVDSVTALIKTKGDTAAQYRFVASGLLFLSSFLVRAKQ